MRRWVTFDCYGTLIDWNRGIRAALARLWPNADAADLLDAYHELEPQVEAADPTASYREVLARCLDRLAVDRVLPLSAADRGALGDSLPAWPAFAEVPGALAELRRRDWGLAILSNTDRDLLEASIGRLGVPIDERVIASEIGSYKPAPKHWRVFFERTHAPLEAHVHVAASVFHDIRPARELGLTTVWINRLGEIADTEPTWELADLSDLPDTLDRLVH